MKNLKNNGITLIALVVTIIILLILAGVTVGMATSGTGLFEKAKEATEKYQNKQIEEEMQIAKYSNVIDSYVSGDRGNTINYSKSAHAVGTYTNGETLWEITINKKTPSTAGAVFEDLTSYNIDKVVYMDGIIEYNEGYFRNIVFCRRWFSAWYGN